MAFESDASSLGVSLLDQNEFKLCMFVTLQAVDADSCAGSKTTEYISSKTFFDTPLLLYEYGEGGTLELLCLDGIYPSVALSVCPMVSAQCLLNYSTIFYQTWYGDVLS